jgi:hypothetical protein
MVIWYLSRFGLLHARKNLATLAKSWNFCVCTTPVWLLTSFNIFSLRFFVWKSLSSSNLKSEKHLHWNKMIHFILFLHSDVINYFIRSTPRQRHSFIFHPNSWTKILFSIQY